LTLALDDAGAMLLGGAGLLWCAAGFYASTYMCRSSQRSAFAIWWLLTLTGSLGVFIVADMTSFYLAFALVSLSAYGLVAYEGTQAARRAGTIYMVLALLGEAFLLLAFVMLAAGTTGGNPMIRDAVALLPSSSWCGPVIVLLILGFGLKMGLVPLHVWMPLAHPVAPMPASAVLSGIIVKAGVIGLIRFLPLDTALPFWGMVLMALGLFTAFYAVIVGLTQQHPKVVLAYSTVSQMGLVGGVIGAGLAAGTPGTAVLAAFYALHHLLVKGALFLGVGIVAKTGRRHTRLVMAVMALLALSLAGLPFTSGMLAKLAVKDVLGNGIAMLLATLSATGSTLLMLHFLRRVSTLIEDGDERAETGLLWPWAVIATASLVVVWALFPSATGYPFTAIFELKALWAASWPILLGGALAFALRGYADRLPRIPEGDAVVLAEALLPSLRRLMDGLERIDGMLRQWPVAGLLLLVIVIALGAALQLGP
ncbi:MAG TPA: complex I subunit 5 family protein, partial [Tardiphaga sp.]